ncbi:hypothetical protein [Roseicella sp. DB1501]|uniref:hypothetical protein n=1 Tax=Roseicella sp. DB1501 TaxID=2730925 RepID=UPI0014912679|nr:hypothetical protein [Roseicella sp. DB1501]NOG72025.1 hypothetical protein [Roseicella sp. DB1501]
MPENEPRRRPDLIGLIGLAVILAVLGGAYLLFPWVQRTISYQDCIASGRITGC